MYGWLFKKFKIQTKRYESARYKQGRSSSIGAKIISFMLRQFIDDFKEGNTEEESVQYQKTI